MALIGLLLVVFTIIFFAAFSTQHNRQGEVFQAIGGFMEVLIINFLLIILLLLLAWLFSALPISANIPIFGFGGLGISQLLYVIPRSLFLKRRQRWAKLDGVIAAALIVALLNGGCWVFIIGVGGV